MSIECIIIDNPKQCIRNTCQFKTINSNIESLFNVFSALHCRLKITLSV